MWIRRAQPFREDIADTGQLDHCAHPTRRDHAGALCGRAQDHLAGPEMAQYLMRYGTVAQRHSNQAFFGPIDSFANRFGHFVGFSESIAHQTVLIASDYQRTETEAPTALDDL